MQAKSDREFSEKVEKSPWISYVNKIGLAGVLVTFVHAGRVFAPILAQLLYMAEPFTNNRGNGELREFARLLEDDEQSADLLAKLDGDCS